MFLFFLIEPLILAAVMVFLYLIKNEYIILEGRKSRINWNDPDIIIDAHVHVWRGTTAKAAVEQLNAHALRMTGEDMPLAHSGSYKETLKAMDRAGISASIMMNFTPLAQDQDAVNRWTLTMGSKFNSLIGFVSVHPDMKGDPVERLRKMDNQGKLNGLKINPTLQEFLPDDPKLIPVYEYCQSVNVPVVFHAGASEGVIRNEYGYSDINNFIPIFEKFPRLTVILAHMGGLGNAKEAVAIAKKYPRVCFDTSIALSGSRELRHIRGWLDDIEAVAFIRTIGADRILFGSDSPLGFAEDDINRIRRLPLSTEEKRAILGRNAVRAFRLSN